MPNFVFETTQLRREHSVKRKSGIRDRARFSNGLAVDAQIRRIIDRSRVARNYLISHENRKKKKKKKKKKKNK